MIIGMMIKGASDRYSDGTPGDEAGMRVDAEGGP
jgi:hypothetical protein